MLNPPDPQCQPLRSNYVMQEAHPRHEFRQRRHVGDGDPAAEPRGGGAMHAG